MKKIVLSLVLCFLVLSLSLPIFATSVSMNDGISQEIQVRAILNDNIEVKDVYKVDIDCGEMKFTCDANGSRTWNPDTHSFDDTINTSWSAVGNTIKVTNHSSKDITVNFDYTPNTNFNNVVGTFESKSLQIRSAIDTSIEDAPYSTNLLDLSGKMNKSEASLINVGNIIVTVS